jgi:hypothetical protein
MGDFLGSGVVVKCPDKDQLIFFLGRGKKWATS